LLTQEIGIEGRSGTETSLRTDKIGMARLGTIGNEEIVHIKFTNNRGIASDFEFIGRTRGADADIAGGSDAKSFGWPEVSLGGGGEVEISGNTGSGDGAVNIATPTSGGVRGIVSGPAGNFIHGQTISVDNGRVDSTVKTGTIKHKCWLDSGGVAGPVKPEILS